MAWTVFEYLYRDADNFKSFGNVAFEGSVSAELWDSALKVLDDGTYFIAEQIGLPVLYESLYRWSGDAPTDADHCWHEFVSIAVVDESDLPDSILRMEATEIFVLRLKNVEGWSMRYLPPVEVFHDDKMATARRVMKSKPSS